MRPGLSNALAGRLTFVAAEVVGNHDVAGCEGRHQALADPGGEAVTVDRPVENEWRHDAVVTQSGEEGQASAFRSDQWRSCLDPVAMREVCCAPPAPRGPTASPCHVGLDPPSAGQLIPRINCFPRLDIQEYQALGVKAMLMRAPPGPEPRHLRAKLLAGHQRFF